MRGGFGIFLEEIKTAHHVLQFESDPQQTSASVRTRYLIHQALDFSLSSHRRFLRLDGHAHHT